MYKNQPNFAKNRLHLLLEGKIEKAEMILWSDDLLSKLKKLRPGFTVISEILNCQPATEEVRQILLETQKKVKELGLGDAVRIVAKNNYVTAAQWQRSSRSVGYIAKEAESVEAAEKLLDGMEKNKTN